MARGSAIISSCCCGQGLVVNYCHHVAVVRVWWSAIVIMLLWSGAGGQLRTRSLEGPFRRAFGKSTRPNSPGEVLSASHPSHLLRTLHWQLQRAVHKSLKLASLLPPVQLLRSSWQLLTLASHPNGHLLSQRTSLRRRRSSRKLTKLTHQMVSQMASR